jgi:hypothetical protein
LNGTRWHEALVWVILVEKILPNFLSLNQECNNTVFIKFITKHFPFYQLRLLRPAFTKLWALLTNALERFELKDSLKLKLKQEFLHTLTSDIKGFLPGFLCPLQETDAMTIENCGGSDYIVRGKSESVFFLYGPLSLVARNHKSCVECFIDYTLLQIDMKEIPHIAENDFSVNFSKTKS